MLAEGSIGIPPSAAERTPAGRSGALAASVLLHAALLAPALLLLHAALPDGAVPPQTIELVYAPPPVPAPGPPVLTPEPAVSPLSDEYPSRSVPPRDVASGLPPPETHAAPAAEPSPVPELPPVIRPAPRAAELAHPTQARVPPPHALARTVIPRSTAPITASPLQPSPAQREALLKTPPQPLSAPPTTSTISVAWKGALAAWLERHKYYPEAARQRGEQGIVGMRFTVERGGQVLDSAVEKPSGFDSLDHAAETMLRGAHVPPFAETMTQAQLTLSVQIRFRLTD